MTTLPAFAGDVRVWFAQLESYFAANNVSEQTKLHILFSAFPASLTPAVKDLITDTPLNSTYDSIKREVLLRTSVSAEKRFQTLVHDEHLGDRRPTELLRRMRELAEDVPPDSALIKQLFFSRLPAQVKAILAPMFEKHTVDVVAASADKVMDFVRGPTTAAIPQQPAEVPAGTANVRQDATSVAILTAIERLTREVSKLNMGRSHSPRRRYKSRSSSPHHRRRANMPGLCFYHSRYGAEARNCKMPCTFNNQGN